MLGSQTQVINGQRFDTPTLFQFAPSSYGQQTTGVPNVSPQVPPFIGGGGSAGSGGLESVGGYGTAGNNAQVTAIAAAHPFNPKVSPVWWAVVLLVGSLILLKGIHWRETTLEGFREEGHAGPAREEASESV